MHTDICYDSVFGLSRSVFMTMCTLIMCTQPITARARLEQLESACTCHPQSLWCMSPVLCEAASYGLCEPASDGLPESFLSD